MELTLAIILATLVGLSASIDGSIKGERSGERLHVTLRADPPLSGSICVDDNITFTCLVRNADYQHHYQYQWSVDGGTTKIGNQSFTLQVTSQSVINVTCEVYAHQNAGGNKIQYGASSVTIQPNGTIPQIYFQHVTTQNFVYKLTKRPFNLTATVVSSSNLTSLYWSPPGSVPLPNRIITVHHGNMTTTTFMLLKNASLSDSGNYTVTAVNECGQNSSKIDVDGLTDCPEPEPKLVGVQPQNFTAVVGYNATLKCSFNGRYSLSSPLRMWVLFPHNQYPVYLDSHPYPDCGCWVENKLICPINTDPNDCCKFQFIMHSTPHLDDNGTKFSCTGNFTKKDTAWMFVVPRPKVIAPPQNVTTAVGSKAIFTCDFEATTDNKIAQIHWLFNGSDLAGCSRFQESINCTVKQQYTDKNYISSTLTIYSVQADNAGQYTCYCSYDTSLLNVDGVQVIESDHKSATLSIQSDSSQKENSKTFIIVFGIVFGIVAIFILLGSLIYCIRVHSRTYEGFTPLEQQNQPSEDEIKDEILDQYVTDKLFPLWEKLGKALKLSSSFLEKTYSDNPTNPAERLRAILREWRATADHPSLSILDKILEQLGLANIIPH